MPPTLALLHTTAVTLPVFAEAARAELGGAVRRARERLAALGVDAS